MKLLFLSLLLLIGGILEQCWCQDTVEVESPEPEKINWQPVWDSDLKPGEPVHFEANLNPISPMFPAEPQSNRGPCDAPNGLGVRNLFTEARALLPFEQIRSIVRDAANDAEVRAMIQLLNSPAYHQRVGNLSQSREYRGLHDFACYKMNFDLKLYIDLIKDLLQLSELLKSPQNGTELYKGGTSSGLRGMLQNIRDVLPRQSLRDLYEQLKSSDWYLRRAVRTAKSYEFEAIVKLYRQNPDYKLLRSA